MKHDDALDRVREIGIKARRDPQSLSLEEIDELCRLVIERPARGGGRINDVIDEDILFGIGALWIEATILA